MPTRDIVLVALMAAIIVVLGLVPPLALVFAVPVSLQTLGVMLAGALLGAWRGALAPVVVIVLVAIGLPVLAGGRGGFGVFAGPTAGFLFGWVPGAFVTGWMAQALWARAASPVARIAGLFAACTVGGIAVVYLFGIAWLGTAGGVGLGPAAWGSLAFLPGDLVKAALAAAIVWQVRRAMPDLAR